MDNVDALLVVSFGGPEHPDHVMPFLRNVTAGRSVPDERLAVVAEQYALFGGRSPINDHCRELVAAIEEALEQTGTDLPVYWGNRNWEPFLSDTIQQMTEDGVQNALAFVTSATSSYSGCRQYREDIERARQAAGPEAPEILKLRQYFDHPGFIEPMVDNTTAAIRDLASRTDLTPRLVFTAHSIPLSMAASCDYEIQLREASRLVATRVQPGADWDLVWQSRSGPPQVPWLEPDICDHLVTLHDNEIGAVVVVPIGFVSDHMEVLYDLDTQAQEVANEQGMHFARARAAGADPRFVSMVLELIDEKVSGAPRRALSDLAERPSPCAVGCCPPPPRRP